MTDKTFVERTIEAAQASDDPLVVDLLRLAIESQRINVGLISENSILRKKMTESPEKAEMSNEELFRLMIERGLLTVNQ